MKPYTLHHGDCLAVLRTLPDVSVDAVVCDPPYGLSFMGKRWDYDVPAVEVWAECLRVLKPGGHLLAFAGTRTQHRMAVRIEDAGFDIRDLIAWVYGSGFPKSLDVSKAIDKAGGASPREQSEMLRAKRQAAGLSREQVAELVGCTPSSVRDWEEGRARAKGAAVEFIVPSNDYRAKLADLLGYSADERCIVGVGGASRSLYETGHRGVAYGSHATSSARAWQGWGTALKPALEPITVARKPLDGTVAENVLAHGTGALNVDGCRVEGEPWKAHSASGLSSVKFFSQGSAPVIDKAPHNEGRWPANLIHDGSEEVVGLFPETGPSPSHPVRQGGGQGYRPGAEYGAARDGFGVGYGDCGSAARFFYCAKASKADRDAGCEGFEAKQGCADYRPNDDGTHGLQSRLHGASTKGGNHHPTVKPTDLMRYLCRLVTPPGGVVLDPFTGSGSTGRGAILEGFRFIGVEREADYLAIARARIDDAIAMRARDTAQLTML